MLAGFVAVILEIYDLWRVHFGIQGQLFVLWVVRFEMYTNERFNVWCYRSAERPSDLRGNKLISFMFDGLG